MWEEEKEELGLRITNMLYQAGMIKLLSREKKEGWTLHSGIWSPFYIQLRLLCSKSNSYEMLDIIGESLTSLIKNEIPDITKIVGVAVAGIPVSVITTYKSKIPSCYTRKVPGIRSIDNVETKIKEYGEHSLVEGELSEGDDILIVDDLITTGDSKLIAKKLIEKEAERNGISITCNHTAVIIDREQGGKEELEREGMKLHSLIPFATKGIHWLRESIPKNVYEVIVDYLDNSDNYQDEKIRQQLLEGL